ncbi:MAG TPA: hypothetical protein H9875_03250 [Candidatus Levilactobacillus faecigallinarum]|uniref:Uncharacterized protein n=1 Tax=Candidatus Levilactobacillus faecigallinarum TaxID=2838638 RepID=A0A9D1U4P8_9LACO|nr:hypothetical protein [Candidatus Levilactobacillus faecigallinarum]
MIRAHQVVHPQFRVTVSRATRQQALVPLQLAESRRLALIRGYQAMAIINRDLARVFTPFEEEAERRLTQFRKQQN